MSPEELHLLRGALKIERGRRRSTTAPDFEAAAQRDFPAISLPQRAVCRLLDGLPPTDEVGSCRTSHDPATEHQVLSMAEVYRRLLGRDWGPDLARRRQLAVLVAGRGSAKTLLAGTRAKYVATSCGTGYLAAGERAYVPIVAPRMDAARQTMSFVRAFLQEQGNPGVERASTDLVRFRRRTAISLYAADRGGLSVRSKSLAGLVLDEAGFFYSASEHAVTDQSIIEAALYRLAPDGQVLAITSPWSRSGLCFRAHAEQWGKSDAGAFRVGEVTFDGVLVIQTPAYFLNPKWTPRGEPGTASFAREAEGQFVEDGDVGISTLAMIERAIEGRGPGDLHARHDDVYGDALDLAGGGADRTAYVVGHANADGVIIVDAVRSWGREVPIERRFLEIAELRRRYDIEVDCAADRFAFDAAAALAREHGVSLRLDAGDRASQALRVGELLKSSRLRLPSNPAWSDQLPRICVRAGDGGKLSLYVPRDSRGAHCDEATALALLCSVIQNRRLEAFYPIR